MCNFGEFLRIKKLVICFAKNIEKFAPKKRLAYILFWSHEDWHIFIISLNWNEVVSTFFVHEGSDFQITCLKCLIQTLFDLLDTTLSKLARARSANIKFWLVKFDFGGNVFQYIQWNTSNDKLNLCRVSPRAGRSWNKGTRWGTLSWKGQNRKLYLYLNA